MWSIASRLSATPMSPMRSCSRTSSFARARPGIVSCCTCDLKQVIKEYGPLGFIYQEPSGITASADPDYLHIDPKHVFSTTPGKVDLVYVINEGKPFRLRRIIPTGNHKTQDKVIDREFRDFAPDQPYNSGKVQDAVDRLRGLPYFSSVTVTPIGDDPKYRDLLVEVQEGRTAQFNIGAGITSNGGIQGNISYTQNNFDLGNVPNDWRDILTEHAFTGAGQQFRAEFSPGTIFSNASISFTEPYLFDQPYTFREQLYLHDRLREHYDDRRIGDSISLGSCFDYTWSAQATVRGEEVDIGRSRMRSIGRRRFWPIAGITRSVALPYKCGATRPIPACFRTKAPSPRAVMNMSGPWAERATSTSSPPVGMDIRRSTKICLTAARYFGSADLAVISRGILCSTTAFTAAAPGH